MEREEKIEGAGGPAGYRLQLVRDVIVGGSDSS